MANFRRERRLRRDPGGEPGSGAESEPELGEEPGPDERDGAGSEPLAEGQKQRIIKASKQ